MKLYTYHQDEIRPFLIKFLTNAKKRIHLSIGWVGDAGVLSLLEKKVVEKVGVSLVLLEGATKSEKAAYEELQKKGIHIITLNIDQKDYFIDHKFGVIDGQIVLTGNYSWGHNNAPAETYLNVIEGLPTLATGFEKEFEYLSIAQELSKSASKPSNSIVDFLKKLEVIKTLLSIGDTEFIQMRLEIFDPYKKDKNVSQILEAINSKKFEEALELIKTFTQLHQPLRACIDPPIDSYKREIQLLEAEIAALSNEFNETQKLLHKFSKMHTNVLGDIMQQLLYQTKVKAEIEAKQKEADQEKQDEFEEAKKDHEEYTASHEAAKKEKLMELTPAEQKELKKLYRQTSMKCHPDRVVEELHDQAEEIFVDLNKAYKANDLEKVREIHQQLKSGIMLPKSEGITELKKLESTCRSLTQKLKDWQEKLDQLKAEATYQSIIKIEDWDFYFQDKKEVLLAQLERLKIFNEQATP